MTKQEEQIQKQLEQEVAQRRRKLNQEFLGKWFPMTYYPKGWCFYACPEMEYTMIAIAYDCVNDDIAYLSVIYNSRKRKYKWCTDNLEPINERYTLIAWALLPPQDDWVLKEWSETRKKILNL